MAIAYDTENAFVFDKSFFLLYQKTLLKFVNSWVGKRIFCINGNKSSVDKNEIIKIEPNSITWKGQKRNQYVTEFRTHSKFSKRLYYAFYPIWWLMHQWDTVIANNIQPAWNLGFDTLGPIYPDAGSGNTTVDGQVIRDSVSESWSTLVTSDGNNSDDTGTTVQCRASATSSSNVFSQIRRPIMNFDTSPLTGNANISAVVLSPFENSASNGLKQMGLKFNIYASDSANNNALVNSDYNVANWGSTNFSDTYYDEDNWNAGGYTDITFNSDGRAIISKTGITKLGFRLDKDVSGSPTWVQNATNGFTCFTADRAGTSNDPKLVVTFTLPAVGIKSHRQLIGVGQGTR